MSAPENYRTHRLAHLEDAAHGIRVPVTEITQDDSAIGVMCNDVFGPGWGRFRIAHLATADRIGETKPGPGNITVLTPSTRCADSDDETTGH